MQNRPRNWYVVAEFSPDGRLANIFQVHRTSGAHAVRYVRETSAPFSAPGSTFALFHEAHIVGDPDNARP